MQHTDIPTRSDIERLATIREPGCVSIYVPASPVPAASDLARIELKNHLRTATDQLEASGADEQLVDSITSAVDELLEDRDFWRYQSNSLALFANGTMRETYRLPNKLSGATEVSDRFYVKPLLRALTFPQSAFILALAQNSVRLVEISADLPAAEVAVPDLPHDLVSTVALDLTNDRNTLAHLRTSEDPKVRMREYAQAIERALRPLLATSSRPLIIAAAEPLASIYRSVASYPQLADAVIAGNPEERSEGEFAAAARPILDQLYAAELAELKDRFEESAARGKAVTDLSDVARAATFKAIETLFVDIDQRIPGYVDEESGAVTLSATDDASNYGVIDEILRRALLSDARVFAVRSADVPGGGPVAASVRFPS
ncbi:MAG: baeRF11 domain-containing protein [Lacisediminihabitans sp.]